MFEEEKFLAAEQRSDSIVESEKKEKTKNKRRAFGRFKKFSKRIWS